MQNYSSVFIASLFTLIWALHPANIESVLMGTNWLSLLTYSFCLGLFLHNLLKLLNKEFTNKISDSIGVFLLFVICIFIGEYGYTLPFIIFFTSVAFSGSMRNSLTLSVPYFSGLLFYGLFYFLNHLSNNTTYQSINFSLERLLWFSPQIFTHFLKLFFYPKDLSIYQSNLVPLANSHFEPYSIFSFFIFLSFLILPSIFLKSRGNNTFTFLLIYSFIFSVFPFLHILTPAYCIFAERYCYFPLFLFLFLITTLVHCQLSFSTLSHLLRGLPPSGTLRSCVAQLLAPDASLPASPTVNGVLNNLSDCTPVSVWNKKILTILLVLILLPLSARTIIRLNDWKDSYSLYLSAVKTYKKPVYKGFGYAALGYYFNEEKNTNESGKYFLLSIKTLEPEINKLKLKANKQIPKTLKIYGLDANTLTLNAAFRIASIRFYDFRENSSDILSFYEPFLEENINTAGSSQLDLYAKLLLKTSQPQKALEILKFAKEKYPFSTTIIFSLSNFYLNQKDLTNAEKIITEGLEYYPNYVRILPRAIKLYALKNDLPNLAKYEYLLGLRTHSKEAYQKSLEIYTLLNKSNEVRKIIDKLNLTEKI